VSSGNVVNILVNADGSQATSSFDKVRKSLMVVSAAAAGVGLALTKIGDDFTKATNNIRAGTGATGAELESLKESFRNVASDVPQDFDAVSTAVGQVHTELGLTGSELEKATKQFLDLGRLTGTEVAPMIKSVSDAMDLFGMDAADSGKAMDAFAKAAQVTGVPISVLTSKTTEFGPVLRNLGMDMNQTVALMANLEGAGISVSRIMPGLNASMRRLAASGVSDMGEALQASMRDIKGATTDTEALNLATDLFGAEGAQRMSVAIRDGTVDIEALATTLGTAEGAVESMNEDSLTSADRFTMFKDNLKLMIEPLAGVMANIGPIVFMLPAMISGISALAGITAVQTAATWLWAAAQTALNLVLSPIGLIILGIVAAVALAIVIWKNWDKIVAALTATWEKLDAFMTDQFGPTWETIKEVVGGVITFWKELFKGFVALFKGDWDGAKEHFGAALTAIKDAFITAFDAIWSFFDSWMTDKFGGKWEAVKSVVGAVVTFIGDVFSGLWETLGGIWDLIVGIFTGDTDKIKDGFKGIVNGVISMFNALIRLVNKIGFKLPDWLGGKEFSLDIPEIPKLAEGGIVNKPTLAMIGEAGPEAVVPLNRGGGAMGGVTVNVMMPEGGTVILDDESTAQRFADFITMQIRETLRTQGQF
jgi:TP901 family phage tail tape measure protein